MFKTSDFSHRRLWAVKHVGTMLNFRLSCVSVPCLKFGCHAWSCGLHLSLLTPFVFNVDLQVASALVPYVAQDAVWRSSSA